MDQSAIRPINGCTWTSHIQVPGMLKNQGAVRPSAQALTHQAEERRRGGSSSPVVIKKHPPSCLMSLKTLKADRHVLPQMSNLGSNTSGGPASCVFSKRHRPNTVWCQGLCRPTIAWGRIVHARVVGVFWAFCFYIVRHLINALHALQKTHTLMNNLHRRRQQRASRKPADL